MDVINQIQLPPFLAELSVAVRLLLLLGVFIFLAFIASLAAFINNTPKSNIFRAFFGIILQIILTVTIILVLINLREPPNEEVISIIALVSAMIAFSVCFSTTMVKGAIVAVTTAVMYFLIYKCTILFLQMQYPDIYQQYAKAVSVLLANYQLIR